MKTTSELSVRESFILIIIVHVANVRHLIVNCEPTRIIRYVYIYINPILWYILCKYPTRTKKDRVFIAKQKIPALIEREKGAAADGLYSAGHEPPPPLRR